MANGSPRTRRPEQPDRWRHGAPPLDSPDRAFPRLFVAVPLSDGAREAIAELVEAVRHDAPVSRPTTDVRWVRMEGLHVTLRFLGPTPAERVAALVRAVDDTAKSESPFDVAIRGAGAFPSPSRPRTLWLGIADGSDRMSGLADRLGQRLVADEWPAEERPFRAHLTLARADGRRAGPSVASALTTRAGAFETSFRADRLVLFESITGGGPARYDPVHEAPFGR